MGVLDVEDVGEVGMDLIFVDGPERLVTAVGLGKGAVKTGSLI